MVILDIRNEIITRRNPVLDILFLISVIVFPLVEIGTDMSQATCCLPEEEEQV